MKSVSMRVSAIAALMMIVGCGDTKHVPKPVYYSAKTFQGKWEFATLEEGKTEPKAAGCMAGRENTGVKMSINVLAAGMSFTAVEFINDPTCEGKNRITIQGGNPFDRTSSKGKGADVVQTFVHDSLGYSVKVEGLETVATLNQRATCGFTDWEAKSYTMNQEPLKNCTNANSEGSIIPTKETIELHKNTEIQFKMQGEGLSYDQRDMREKDSKFTSPEFYVRIK